MTSYQYDPNGNLYSRQTLTFKEDNTTRAKASAVLMGYTADTNDMLLEYNNLNQLTAVTKGNEIISYDYYANGMRKSKTVDEVTTTHIWDGQNMAGEVTGDDFTGYLRGNRLIARQTEEDTQYYHFNGHEDTLSLTDGNGIELQNYTYDAFGNVKNFHELDANPFRYCGEYFDTETGFIYLRARYYSPEIGRFISEDPIRDGLNWYVYCGNNPIMFVDPSGEAFETIWDIISLGFSIGDLISNPTDVWAWAGFVGDVVDFIPFVTGVGESIKVVGASKKVVAVADKADEVVDSIKVLKATERVATIKDGAVVMSYKHLKKLTTGTGLEAHHLIEKRFANTIGIKENDILSIAIDPDTHKKITDAFRKALPYSSKRNPQNHSLQKIWNETKKIYAEMGMSEYLDPLKQMLIDAGNTGIE